MSIFTKRKKEGHRPENEHKEDIQGETRYQCPMKCEGEKTYDQPGRCPVCNMYLQPVDK